jgi:peptide/nickel transport system ATP-binding protein
MRALVEAKNVKKHFKVGRGRILHAVDDVSLSIAEREIVGLVGESGSGKSTFGKVLVGLHARTAGEVYFGGESLPQRYQPADFRRYASRMQMIFQDPYSSLNPRMTVGEIIGEGLRLSTARGGAEIREEVGNWLARVGLERGHASRYPHEFSGGQRQRVGIARALIMQPKFVVCDEPISALDVSVQAQILNLMRDLQDQFGLTYLFISHNLAVVRHMATRIGVMYLGRLVEVAPGRDIFERPRHPYTRMLLDAVPDLAMVGRQRKPLDGEIPNPISPPPGCSFHPRCPFAADRCRSEPPQITVSGQTRVACHAVEEGRI